MQKLSILIITTLFLWSKATGGHIMAKQLGKVSAKDGRMKQRIGLVVIIYVISVSKHLEATLLIICPTKSNILQTQKM
jgi:hypothetical protein